MYRLKRQGERKNNTQILGQCSIKLIHMIIFMRKNPQNHYPLIVTLMISDRGWKKGDLVQFIKKYLIKYKQNYVYIVFEKRCPLLLFK